MTSLTHLTNMLNQNKITRRKFITGASALGLSVAVSPFSLPGKNPGGCPQKRRSSDSGVYRRINHRFHEPGNPYF